MNQLNDGLERRAEKEGNSQNSPQTNMNLESAQKALRPYSSFATSIKKDTQKVLIQFSSYLKLFSIRISSRINSRMLKN